MDGAAFSRVTTADESSHNNDSDNNTDTDTSETDEDTTSTLQDGAPGASMHCEDAPQTLIGDAGGEGRGQEGEVKLQQVLGKSEVEESDYEPDYIDLSQSLSPPSSPRVQQTLSSISHSGTLSKRRRPHTTNLPESNNKRVKIGEGSSPHLENIVPIFERPRSMSQWDIKPPDLTLHDQHAESRASNSALSHSFPLQSEPEMVGEDDPATFAPQSFDPPKGPRSMSTIPPICFFFYHQGYCNPRHGRRCDYLHDMSTSQQTVSLPRRIDRHSPTCPLPLCPVRKRMHDFVKQEPGTYISHLQTDIKQEPATPPEIHKLPFFDVSDSSSRDEILAVRGRYPRGMLGQPLPHHTGTARQRFKEQKRRIEQIQFENSIVSSDVAATVDANDQVNQKKKARRRKKGGKKQADRLRRQLEEDESTLQKLNGYSDAFNAQRQLPFAPLDRETPAPTVPAPVGDPNKKRRGPRNRNKKPLHSQRAQELWLGDNAKEEGFEGTRPETAPEKNSSWVLQGSPSSPRAPSRPVECEEKQMSIDRALEMLDAMNQDPRKLRPLTTLPQKELAEMNMPYEYTHESLGLAIEERWAEISKEQARREAQKHIHVQEHSHGEAACEGAAHPATVTAVLKFQHEPENRDLVRRPRCQRCRESKKGCDRQRPCQRCKDAGIGAEGCVDWDGSTRRNERHVYVVGTDSAAGYQLPEGEQRLEWDTDLVRRLFGEIE